MNEESNIHQQEQELLDSVKGFLALYLNQILDDPDQLIKLAIQERDEEIKVLKKELEELEVEVAELKASMMNTEDSTYIREALLNGLKEPSLNASNWYPWTSTSAPSSSIELTDLGL